MAKKLEKMRRVQLNSQCLDSNNDRNSTEIFVELPVRRLSRARFFGGLREELRALRRQTKIKHSVSIISREYSPLERKTEREGGRERENRGVESFLGTCG